MIVSELNFNSVMIGSEHPEELGEFYASVFDRPADMKEGGWYGWRFGGALLSVGQHSEVKGRNEMPGRFIINFETQDVKGEFKRIKGLGVTVVAEDTPVV